MVSAAFEHLLHNTDALSSGPRHQIFAVRAVRAAVLRSYGCRVWVACLKSPASLHTDRGPPRIGGCLTAHHSVNLSAQV